MWGDTVTSPNANIVVELITKHNLVCMNSGAPTHYHQASQSFTHIDISLCSNIISQSLIWSRLDDLYGSDHYPIVIAEMGIDSSLDSPSRWCFRRADCTLFRNATKIFLSPLSFSSIDKALEYFLDVVIKGFENAIPQVMPSSKPRVPWWNPECREAIRKRKKALRRFHRTKCSEDFIKYKLSKTKVRRTLRVTRRAYTKNFLSSLNSSIPTNVMYKRIRRFVHHNDYNPPTVLRYGDEIMDLLWRMH